MLADLFSVNSHLDFALCTLHRAGGRGVEKGAFFRSFMYPVIFQMPGPSKSCAIVYAQWNRILMDSFSRLGPLHRIGG